MSVRVGNPAPDFTVSAYVRGLAKPRTISLAALRGRWVALFFYPQDFAYICPEEMLAFARLRREFAQAGAVVLGANADSYHSHKAWFEGDARLSAVQFPIIADTTRQLSAAFGMALPGGVILRGAFLIDPAGVVRYQHVNDRDAGRNVEEMLHLIRVLQASGSDTAPRYGYEPTIIAAECVAV